MKKLLLLIVLSFCVFINLQAQMVEWVQPTMPQCTTQLKVVENGNNLIVTDKYDNGSDRYYKLSAYSKSGAILWSKQVNSLSTSSYISFRDCTVDKNKNIYFEIFTSGQFEIDGNSYNQASGSGNYTVKLDSTGNILSVSNPIISPGYASLINLANDRHGNMYYYGSFSDTLYVGNTTLISQTNSSDLFLAKISQSGNYEWVKQFGSNSYDSPKNIQVTPNGNVFVIGATGDSAQIGSFFKKDRGHFIAKFDSQGNVNWMKEMGNLNNTQLQIDNNENIYITGGFYDSITVFQTTISTPGKSNSFFCKLDTKGNVKWINKVFASPDGHSNVKITIDKNNKIFLFGSANSNVEIGSLNIPVKTGTLNSYIVQLDENGNTLWGLSIFGEWNSLHSITTDSDANLYILGQFQNNLQLGPFNLVNNLINHYNNPNWDCYGGFFAKLNTQANAVTGNVFIDSNGNGVQDGSEENIRHVLISANPGAVSHAVSSVLGSYTLYLPDGNFNLSIPHPPKHYTVNPISHAVNFTGTGQSATGNDFALVPVDNITDATVSATNLTPARPGFPLAYKLQLKNSGTISLTDSLTFKYDNSRLVFDSASVQPSYHQNGKLQWNYQLNPRKNKPVTVYFTVNASTALGDTLTATTYAGPYSGDAYTQDNQEEVKLEVIGSYDPNDKQVLQQTISPAGIQAGEYLDYIIRFQNTGTDTAFTVRVEDTLSSKLDLSSIQIVSSSHNYDFHIYPNNKVNWIFSNILLPDSNTNEPASHGFIRFRIKARQNLRLGEKIENRAAIYFDFNEPIITNTALTTVEQPWVETNQLITVYPNPTRYQATLQALLNSITEEQEVQIRLVNLVGQKMWSQKVSTGRHLKLTLNLDGMVKGMYLVQVIAGDEVLTTKLLVE